MPFGGRKGSEARDRQGKAQSQSRGIDEAAFEAALRSGRAECGVKVKNPEAGSATGADRPSIPVTNSEAPR
jgi:hypothetical protein